MLLKLTRIYGGLVVINSDKIIYFTRLENGTRLWLGSDNECPVDVTEDLEYVMNCLEN